MNENSPFFANSTNIPFPMAGNAPARFGHSSSHQGHNNHWGSSPNHNHSNNSFVNERDELRKQNINLMDECLASKFSIENEKALHKQSLAHKAGLENKINELNNVSNSLASSKRALEAKYTELQQTNAKERKEITSSFNEHLLEKDKQISELNKALKEKEIQIKELSENQKRPDAVSISPEEYQSIKNQIKNIKEEYLDFRNEAQATILHQCKSMKLNFNTVLLAERERSNQIVKKIQEFYSKKLSLEIERMREQQKEIESLAFESSGYSADLEETRKLLHKAQINCSKLEASNNELTKKINKMTLKK